MLRSEFFVSSSANNELIFAWLAPIYVIIGVEKRPIANHNGHLVALMHDLKVSIHVKRCNLDLLVILRQDVHLMPEVVDELLWEDVLNLDFTDVQRSSVSFPHLVMHKMVLFISVD